MQRLQAMPGLPGGGGGARERVTWLRKQQRISERVGCVVGQEVRLFQLPVWVGSDLAEQLSVTEDQMLHRFQLL